MHAICMMDSNHLSLKLMAKKKDIFQVFHHFQYKDTANVCTLPLKVLSVLRREKKLFFFLYTSHSDHVVMRFSKSMCSIY